MVGVVWSGRGVLLPGPPRPGSPRHDGAVPGEGAVVNASGATPKRA